MFNKYYPTKSELNINNVKIIEEWLMSFKKSIKCKPLLIYGNTGVGKTHIVNTILSENNYNIKYGNLDNLLKSTEKDIRKDVKNYIESYFCSFDIKSFLNNEIIQNNKILVIDENFISNFSQLKLYLILMLDINKNNYPIIFILNNKHNKLLNELKKKCITILIEQPLNNEIKYFINKILKGEKINMTNELINDLIQISDNDYKKLIINMYDLIMNYITNKTVTQEQFKNFKKLIVQKNIKDELFPSSLYLINNYTSVEICLKKFNFEKILIPLIIQQHYIDKIVSYENKLKPESRYILNDFVKNISNSISYSDLIDNYIFNEQKWNLINIYGYFSCSLPSYYLKYFPITSIQLKFPVDMNKTSIQKINIKQIFIAYNTFNFMEIEYYLYVIQLFKYLIINIDNKNYKKKLINIMNYYNLSFDKIEKILKIDKINNLVITSKIKKDKKIIELILRKK